MARLFASYGAMVGAHYYRNKASAEQLASDIKETGGTAAVFYADLATDPAHTSLVQDFIAAFNGIDVLVNNAGANIGNHPFWEMDFPSWQHTFNLNCTAPFFLSQQAFIHMKDHEGGRIINISSVGAKYGGSTRSIHYAGAKGALEAITRGLSQAGAPHNILVNAIRGGFIDTAFHHKAPKEDLKKRIELIPLGRAGTPEDVARMALFLASQGGDYITGQVFSVTGGD
jgi:3-oxoacyl-[acyl-carrier protein] reductase